MSDSTETKACPFCAETIKAAAKVCPFCRSKQSRYALWRQELPLAAAVLMPLITAIVIIAMVAPDEKGVGGRSFVGHRSDLVVLNTSLDRPDVKPDFWLVGVVTNQGRFPWRVHELEIRFLDERSKLVDVRHPKVKEVFVVQPAQEHGFRVALDSLVFTNTGVQHQVRVQVATDGDRPVKPD